MERKKSRLYLFQFSFRYGNEIYLPYSAMAVWAYARTVPEVADNFENARFVFDREQPEAILSRLEEPDVAAFSTYVWNWEMSIAVAQLIKRRFPECLIVFGGPQVPDPDRMGDFFQRHPYIDIAVHGEGEVTFGEILKQRVTTGNYLEIDGLSHRGISTSPRARTRDLSIFPSPYLTDVVDSLLELPYTYQTVWETNRGCPYGCTFCDWGGGTMIKLASFDEDRLYKEIDFFGKHRISHVYSGDANFGILPRDVKIAQYIAETKRRTGGFPSKLRVNYAKNNPERVHQIAKILNAEKLDKGITLSVQSMDEGTLKIIKRTNLKFDTITSFIRQYQREGINTYTEVILGLPGETYETFRDGIETLLEASAHDSVWIYRCTLLPNAPMSDAAYLAMHKIRSVRTPIFLNHTVPGSDPVQEYEETVVETATLSRADYDRCGLLAWAVQAFHALGLTQAVAIYVNALHDVGFHEFYETLLDFGRLHPETIIGREVEHTQRKFCDVFDNGGSWNEIVPEFSNATWALEEASYLRIALERDRFYRELELFLDHLASTFSLRIDPEVRSDLLRYQQFIVVKYERDFDTSLTLSHSLFAFHRGALTGERAPLQRGRFVLRLDDPPRFDGDLARYSTEIVFWGRRGGKAVYQDIDEESLVPAAALAPAGNAAARVGA